ncbi:hypothetical protein [Pseudomonas orientalis]|uniref:hypothetical protein n=1 Tax=Pseudomonas orientalis TaxID=76758 RepID=UPI000F6DD5A9|nr:hypothetical protein [Pseudomonas orientalis]AZE87828.1 hypothetical protein C4J97_1111 [Pseudomonas orientalis]
MPEWLLQRLARAAPVLLVADCHVVALRVREVFAEGGPSLVELEGLINRCGALLLG